MLLLLIFFIIKYYCYFCNFSILNYIIIILSFVTKFYLLLYLSIITIIITIIIIIIIIIIILLFLLPRTLPFHLFHNHLCGSDKYCCKFSVISLDRFETYYNINGPNKNYSIHSIYTKEKI